MSLSSGAEAFSTNAPADVLPGMQVKIAPPYEPDVTAYKADPANDRAAALKEQLQAGKIDPLRLSIGCIDGRREIFDLDEADTKAYLAASLAGDLEQREALVNRRITHRRLTTALEAYRTLESGRPVSAIQDACLREFDGIILRTTLREGERSLREHAATADQSALYEVLRPKFADVAERALPLVASGTLREDEFWDGFDAADGFHKPWHDREYLARGGPAFRQQLISNVWDAEAKCVAGDTVVPLLDGSNPTIRELAGRTEPFWVYACDGEKVVPALAHSARSTGVKAVVDVVLDTGEVVRTTRDHRFMLRFGEWREAGDLKPGDRLMPLYREFKAFGNRKTTYESVYHPGLDLWEKTHRMVARTAYPEAYFTTEKRHVDHIDENSRDNRPENLQVLTESEHMRKTGKHNWAVRRSEMIESLAKGRTPESYVRKSVARRGWWAKLSPERRAEIAGKQSVAQRASRTARSNQARLSEMGAGAAFWRDCSPEDAVRHAQATSAGVKATWANRDTETRSAIAAKGWETRRALNHRVLEIRDAGEVEVFDLSVEGYHNFAIGAGVFIHNCYFAWSHDPVIAHGVSMLAEFPLGRGVQIIAQDPALQNFIDTTTKRWKFDHFLRVWTMQISRDGELFVRKIRNGDGTIDLVDADPQTIWEVITDAENIAKVFYFLQRYPTRFQLDSADVPAAQVRYIDRTIGAGDMVWLKINADSHDVRGRGDPFPALGWAKRLRDYGDAEVQKAQALAAYQWIIQVNGGRADLQNIANQVPEGKPESGSSWIVNKQVEVKASPSGASGVAGSGSVYEFLLNQIALAFGLPKDYFGVTSRGSRATALVAADPASKRFEDRQNIIKGELVEPLIDAAIDEARRFGLLEDVKDFTWRASFPAIIKADAASRAKLLREATAAGVISHKTQADEMVGELDLEDYDYDDEMEQIRKEIDVPGWMLSAKDVSSVKRGLPAAADVAFDPGEVPNPAPGDAGGPTLDDPAAASPGSATGAAKIHDEVGAHEARAANLQRLRVQEAARIVSAAGGVVILK